MAPTHPTDQFDLLGDDDLEDMTTELDVPTSAQPDKCAAVPVHRDDNTVRSALSRMVAPKPFAGEFTAPPVAPRNTGEHAGVKAVDGTPARLSAPLGPGWNNRRGRRTPSRVLIFETGLGTTVDIGLNLAFLVLLVGLLYRVVPWFAPMWHV